VEAIVEKLDVKSSFAELETYVDVNAVLASNTSCFLSQQYRLGV
jgi:3-hydroxyacyl-CoA dehydrogenase